MCLQPPKTVLSILNRETWTQGSLARQADGKPCYYDSPEAVKFCLLGAVSRVYGNDDLNIMSRVNSILNGSIIVFNDSHSWEDVEALIKKAGL